MIFFVLRRFGVMVLTALALTFVVFYLTNLPPNLEKLARTEGSPHLRERLPVLECGVHPPCHGNFYA